MTAGASESLENLHVSLTYVYKSDVMLVDLLVPRSSTPLDILRLGVARWKFFLGCVWLGHWVITNHVCAQAVTRSYPVPSKTGNCPLIIKDCNLRSLVTSDAYEGGGVTLGN